jgi:uncharacterized Zn ribbon protein
MSKLQRRLPVGWACDLRSVSAIRAASGLEIWLVDSDHENSCKMDGMAFGLKACFVKKA